MNKQDIRLEMNKHTSRMVMSMFLISVLFGPSLLLPGKWSLVPLLLIFPIMFYSGRKIEKLKNKVNIRSMKEVIAFEQDTDINTLRKQRGQFSAMSSKVLPVTLVLLGMGIIAAMSYAVVQLISYLL